MPELIYVLLILVALALIWSALETFVVDGGNWLLRKLGFKGAGKRDDTAADHKGEKRDA